MLFWFGLISILIGVACFPIDRKAAHFFYGAGSARFHRFLDATTHWAKAGHWLIAALLALGVARAMIALKSDNPDFLRMSDCSLAFIFSLGLGSTILHVIKLILGRRRPRDDIEMGRYGFVPLAFDLNYNSFPSGHALTISCVSVIFTCTWPFLTPVWFAVAAWLALTRAFLTAHFLSDVFIGGGIGLLCARFVLTHFFPALMPAWF